MVYRKGVSAIVFKRKGKKAVFLVLHRKLNWAGYEIMKGGLMAREGEEHALGRELREETGIRRYCFVKTGYEYKYLWTRDYVKDNRSFNGAHFRLFVVMGLGKSGKIKIDKKEHSGYSWVTAKKALKMLTYKDQRDALRFVLKNYF
jgi:8-oxo-dGTP pyrophosphatase MutT (NUDIX family)